MVGMTRSRLFDEKKNIHNLTEGGVTCYFKKIQLKIDIKKSAKVIYNFYLFLLFLLLGKNKVK